MDFTLDELVVAREEVQHVGAPWVDIAKWCDVSRWGKGRAKMPSGLALTS